MDSYKSYLTALRRKTIIKTFTSKSVIVGSVLLSLWHISDVALDILYLKETPMENDDFYLLLAFFLVLPVAFVMVIAFIVTVKFKKGPLGFIMFTIGGLTNSPTAVLKKYFHIEDEYHTNWIKFILSIIYMVFEDLP